MCKKKIFYFLFLFLSCLSSCKYINSSKNNIPVVKVQKPLTKVQALKYHYIGIIKSIRNVTIKARVDGYLEERYFKDGDYIKEDQLLYRIDERPYQAQLLYAQGAVDKAKADLTFQEIQYKRYQELLAKKAISKSSYDQQVASYLAAKGQLESAQGDLEKARINLEFCRIHSPLSGLAGKTMIDPGNLVSSNGQNELLNIVQLDPIRVEFNPAAWEMKFFLKYKKNAPYPVQVSIPQFPQKQWEGVVDFYNNVINSNSSTILLRTTISNKSLLLRPDLFVDVYVTLDPKHKIVLVPVSLIKQTQGIFQLWVVDAKNKIQLRKVVPGIVNMDMIEINNGLELGDLILLSGQPLPAGTIVKPELDEIQQDSHHD